LQQLKAKISQLGLERDVTFLGPLDQESLRNWYAYCDAVVLPTQFMEGLPRVLLEAQAMKKPVIAYDAGGIAEAIRNGHTGFVIPKGDVRQLTDKIAELLRDERKRIQMGLCGRDYIVNRFDLSKLAERHEEFYLNALRNSS
jgi:glycosyltransferase involved in cell wall biosynthesis